MLNDYFRRVCWGLFNNDNSFAGWDYDQDTKKRVSSGLIVLFLGLRRRQVCQNGRVGGAIAFAKC